MLTWEQILTYSKNGNLPPNRRVEKSESAWKKQLSPEQYRITRQAGTERPFSSVCSYFSVGVYQCVCCSEVLFDAVSQFDSGSGWPSFTQPASDNVIAYYADQSLGMTRIEAKCNSCDAHLGHVFPDGPPPSGLRFCMNAAALVKMENSG